MAFDCHDQVQTQMMLGREVAIWSVLIRECFAFTDKRNGMKFKKKKKIEIRLQ